MILAVAGAFLGPPARRFLGVLVTVGLIGFVIGEQALLLDVAASALAGWAAAGLAGLVFGSPVGGRHPVGGRARPEQARRLGRRRRPHRARRAGHATALVSTAAPSSSTSTG
ncbi:MAG: hypothetical protein R2726_15555 [Acidimicrobiales bacterium]